MAYPTGRCWLPSLTSNETPYTVAGLQARPPRLQARTELPPGCTVARGDLAPLEAGAPSPLPLCRGPTRQYMMDREGVEPSSGRASWRLLAACSRVSPRRLAVCPRSHPVCPGEPPATGGAVRLLVLVRRRRGPGSRPRPERQATRPGSSPRPRCQRESWHLEFPDPRVGAVGRDPLQRFRT